MQLKVEDKNNDLVDVVVPGSDGQTVPCHNRHWTFTMSDKEVGDFVYYMLKAVNREEAPSTSLASLLLCSSELFDTLIFPSLHTVCPLLAAIIGERRRLGSSLVAKKD